MRKSLSVRRLRLLAGLFMIAALLICTFLPVVTEAATGAVSTDICVVYDNSGSTYRDETWCRYKYALEIMASLIDYDSGARLFIYPLCEVSLDGRNSSASTEPIVIDSYKDIGKITNMYTTRPTGTPFSVVVDAASFLERESSADQKHLVILTDGCFDSFSSSKVLEEKLLQIAQSMDVHYLGSGDAVQIFPNKTEGLYAYHFPGVADAQDLLDFVTDLCSNIFRRTSTMNTNSQQKEFNLTESGTIIVYASGREATIVRLTAANETGISLLHDTGRHQYSTISAEGFQNAPVDTTLGGYISIFECTVPGEYSLQCANADSVNVYLQDSLGALEPVASAVRPDDRTNPILNTAVITLAVLFVLIIVVLCGLLFYTKTKKDTNAVNSELSGNEHSQKKPLPYKGNKSYIFISYSHRDEEVVLPIVRRMINDGYRVWYDEDIKPGTKYDEYIAMHIKHCSYFIAFMSKHYLQSTYCINELNHATNLEKNRFLVYLKKLDLTEGMQMRQNSTQNIQKYVYPDEQSFFEKLYQAEGLSEHKD